MFQGCPLGSQSDRAIPGQISEGSLASGKLSRQGSPDRRGLKQGIADSGCTTWSLDVSWQRGLETWQDPSLPCATPVNVDRDVPSPYGVDEVDCN